MKKVQVVRRVGGPDVELQSEAFRQQLGDLGLDDLRQYREVAHEGLHQDRVVLGMHPYDPVLDRTER